MKSLLTVAALLLFSCGAVHSAIPERPPTASTDLQIVRAEFGLMNISESGRPQFIPSRTIPLKVDQEYGWVILVKTSKAKIKLREEFTLPSAPEIWGGFETLDAVSISADRRTAMTEQEVEPVEGFVFRSWTVAPGDPAGRYRIRIIIDDSVEQVFEFDVE